MTPERMAAHLFRDRWRDVIATLARQFGGGRLADIEDAVQGAFLKALDRWSLEGPPANPGGWIYTVARNALLDRIRAERGHAGDAALDALPAAPPDDGAWVGALADNVLRMILVCTHPRLTPRESLAVTLRLVCGLGEHELANALLLSDAAARKLLTRTRDRMRALGLSMDPPDREGRAARLGRVLQIVYLLFNEGYSAHTGDAPVRAELCREAERLLDLLVTTEAAADGRVWALAALVAFQGARLPARAGPDGRLLRLAEQDRRLWDRGRVARGFACLDRSLASERRSRYHLEAAIAACHAMAPTYEDTDWPRILALYDDLLALVPSPVVALNRAVALAMVEGAVAGLAALDALDGDLGSSYLLPAVRAELLGRAGREAEAQGQYERALGLSRNGAVQRFLDDRRAGLAVIE